MCWCDPHKRTPVCDTCQEKMDGWYGKTTGWRKYDPAKDTLNKRTKLRLGGKEGHVDQCLGDFFLVIWSDQTAATLNLKSFPGLEVAEEKLTIPKATKRVLMDLVLDLGPENVSCVGKDCLMAQLDRFEET